MTMPYRASATLMPPRSFPDWRYFAPQETGARLCEASAEYRPRRSEDNPLYGIVSSNLETYLEMQFERERVSTPIVERELRAFIECGVLGNGFLRVH